MEDFDPTYPKYINKGYELKYPLKLKDANDYVPGISYNVKDVVRHLGSLFESKRNYNTNVPATYDKDTGVIYFNTDYWDILVNNTGEYILHDEIYNVVASDSEVNLEISPTIAFSGENTRINIISFVKTGGNITEHNVSNNSHVIVSGTSSILNHIETINANSNINYTSTAVVNGKRIQTSQTLVIVGKIYYGSGKNPYDANIQDTTPRDKPDGVYNINVKNNGDYIFIDIPNSMHVNKINVNGFILPYIIVESSRLGYTCYKSTNTYDSGIILVEIL